MIHFDVIGEPKAQPRPRAFAKRFGTKFVARVYDAGTAEGWKAEIALAARPHLPAKPIYGPIGLTVAFRFSRPRSHYGTGKNAARLKASAPRHHTSKPDLDNLIKAVKDCLTTIGMWRDDSQVIHEISSKEYAVPPGVSISIEMENPESPPP